MLSKQKRILAAIMCATSFAMAAPATVSYAAVPTAEKIDEVYDTDDNDVNGQAAVKVNEDQADISLTGKHQWDGEQGKTSIHRGAQINNEGADSNGVYDTKIEDSITVQDTNWSDTAWNSRKQTLTSAEGGIEDTVKVTKTNDDGTPADYEASRKVKVNKYNDDDNWIEDTVGFGGNSSSVRTTPLGGTTFTSRKSDGTSSATIINGGNITTDSLTIDGYSINSDNIAVIVSGTGGSGNPGTNPGGGTSADVTALENRVDTVENNVKTMDTRMNDMNKRVDDLDDRLDDVGAMSAAIASLKPLPYKSSVPVQVSAGVGTYKGATALALGLFRYADEDTLLNFSMSTSGDELMAGFGATWNIQ